jgi:hypothetical protein
MLAEGSTNSRNGTVKEHHTHTHTHANQLTLTIVPCAQEDEEAAASALLTLELLFECPHCGKGGPYVKTGKHITMCAARARAAAGLPSSGPPNDDALLALPAADLVEAGALPAVFPVVAGAPDVGAAHILPDVAVFPVPDGAGPGDGDGPDDGVVAPLPATPGDAHEHGGGLLWVDVPRVRTALNADGGTAVVGVGTLPSPPRAGGDDAALLSVTTCRVDDA